MVTVVVTFELPPGVEVGKVVDTFRAGTQKWAAKEGLLAKYYLVSEQARSAGGVYVWRSRAAADAVFAQGFVERITKKYGAAPTVAYFDTPIAIDNRAGTVELF